jgi:hypothetical protein
MKIIHTYIKNRYTLFVFGLLGLALSLALINPNGQSFIILLLPILFFWVVIFSLGLIIMKRLFKVGARWIVIPSIVATTTTLLVMFSAIDSVSLIDVLLVASLTGVGTFYFNRTWPK